MFIYVPVHFNLRHRGSCSLVQCLCSATRREQRFNLVRHASVHGALPSGGLVLGSVAGVAVTKRTMLRQFPKMRRNPAAPSGTGARFHRPLCPYKSSFDEVRGSCS